MKGKSTVAVVLVTYSLLSISPAAAVLKPAACQASPPILERVPVVRRVVGNNQEHEVVRLVNAERARRGLRPLAASDRLMVDARQWSEVQASRGRMYHSRMGYRENVAYGQQSPQEVVRTWMNSSGHRKNILAPSTSAIGVGLAYSANGRPYWTQVFN
jgi:uncharacterized protein YkwD